MSKVNCRVSRKVSLPINKDITHQEFVPQALKFEDNKKVLEQVAIAIQKNLPVLLIGETGSGKTSLIRYLAENTKNAFRRVNHNGGTTVDDIIGKILVNDKGTFWVDGVLVDAMRKGYWYLADEINAAAPEINFVYHSLLDDDGYVVLIENQGEIVRPHPNFRFFAAMNPPMTYAGTKELNKALMSRFMVVKTEFPAPKIEIKILVERTGIDKDKADKMIKFSAEVRANHSNEKYDFVLSTRDLLMWANMFKFYGRYISSAEMTILNKVGPDDFESIKDLLSMHFLKLDENANKEAKEKQKLAKEEKRLAQIKPLIK